MSATSSTDVPHRDETAVDPNEDATVEVCRNGRLAAAIASAAVLVAAAFVVRGGAMSYAIGAVLLVVAAIQAWSAYDSRMPLLLVDRMGVRIRHGHAWRGLPWDAVEEIEHLPRRGLRDGRLAILVRDEDEQVAGLGRAGWHARLTHRLYGVPFAVPLGIGTRVVGAGDDLTGALADLVGPQSGVVEIDESLTEDAPEDDAETDAESDDLAAVERPDESFEPAASEDEGADEGAGADETDTDDLTAVDATDTDEQPALGHQDTNPRLDRRSLREAVEEPTAGEAPETVTASATPSPLREVTDGVRADVTWEPGIRTSQHGSAEAEDGPVAVHGANALRLDPAEWDGDTEDGTEDRTGPGLRLADGVTPIATPGDAVEPLTLDDPDLTGVLDPAPEPVIGPDLAAARTRLGLSTDTLAERTRIRPHVIEAIEVDDFGPCGGDFYARGHLRTLARVLGIEVAPLLARYDDQYASGAVDPRVVFQADLATGSGGAMRRMRGGPNWSVLVAAVMGVVLLWSVVQLITDATRTDPEPGISLGAAAEQNRPYAQTADPVPVELTAEGGGARVIVRDARGKVAFTGAIAFGETKTLKVAPPVRVQTSDGSLEVSVDGGGAEAMGETGEAAQQTFTVN